MKKLFLLAISSSLVLSATQAQQAPAAVKVASDSTKSAPPKKPSLGDKTKGQKKSEGLFTIFQDTLTGSVQLYVKKDQLDKEFIYQSFSINGPTTLFLNQSMHRQNLVFTIKRAYDKLEFSIVNTSLYYDKNNPVSKTAQVDKPEAVFFTDKFSFEDADGYLVSADQLFLSEKLDPIKQASMPGMGMSFGLGMLNPTKSKYAQVRTFQDNIDVVVDLSYDNPSAMVPGGLDVVDPRYVRVRMQHSLIAMPNNDFKPRMDDPRVGFFSTEVTDRTSVKPTPYRDMIHHWHLKKKDPSAAMSEPVEPLVYWIENTTPPEYRKVIFEAGMKWNEAFEKAGFKNALQMKIMPDDATWDPADIHYNVIRWVASSVPSYGAIGPSFVNPRTGQILGADITVEFASASSHVNMDELINGSNLQAYQLQVSNHHNCSLASELKSQYTTGLTTLEMAGASATEIKEMHEQFLTYLIMHEMGHTLGLNHNMKASHMLSPAEIHNTAITRKMGLIGSVMDYPAINIALDRTKQGDYYTTKAGPYDLWAIEYAYREFNSEAESAIGLKKILSRSTDPKLIFGNDADDMRAPGKAMDPRVNVNDLTSDPIAYAEERMKLVNNLLGKLLQKYTKPNQSYAELRARYGNLLNQRRDMIEAVNRYVGGIYVDRSFPDQQSANKPYTPVPVEQQKRAINFLNNYLFVPTAFDADAKLYPYLQLQRRGFNQPPNGEDYKILSAQTSLAFGAFAQLLNPNMLQRMTNTSLYGNTYAVTDLMNDLVKGVFDADMNASVNPYRQYLQTAFVKGLGALTAENSPLDNVAKSAAFYTLKKLKTKMAAAAAIGNEQTKAHRSQLLFIIEKATKVN